MLHCYCLKTKNKGYRKGTGSCLCVDTEGEESEPGSLEGTASPRWKWGQVWPFGEVGLRHTFSWKCEFLCLDELFSGGPRCYRGVLVGLDLMGVHNGAILVSLPSSEE